MGRSLEAIAFQACPYCHGEGTVKAVSTVSIEVFRRLRKVLIESRFRNVEVSVHPEVATFLSSSDRALISFVERNYRCRVRIKAEPVFHIEDIKIGPALR